MPLTPIQQWFFGLGLERPEWWNQMAWLDVAGPLDPALLASALDRVAAAHDAFRLRFRCGPDGWTQWLVPGPATLPLSVHDLSDLNEGAIALQKGWDLAEGPLGRAAWFAGEDGSGVLAVAVHHLIVDGVSWRILLDDLAGALAGETPAHAFGFATWARSHAILTPSASPVPASRRRLPRNWTVPDIAGNAGRLSVSFNAEDTARITIDAPAASRLPVDALILSALSTALEDLGAGALPIAIESHGRATGDADLSRTVGWFTTFRTVTLPLGTATSAAEAATALEQATDGLPANASDWPEVSVNYLGRIGDARGGSGWRLRREPTVPVSSPENARPFALDVVALVSDGLLEVTWLHAAGLDPAMVERWSARFASALIEAAAQARTGIVPPKPSDLPLARLDAATLARIAPTLPAPIADAYPLTPLQLGMLFHAAEQPESGVYVEQLAGLITGSLQEPPFLLAWQDVIDLHPPLPHPVRLAGRAGAASDRPDTCRHPRPPGRLALRLRNRTSRPVRSADCRRPPPGPGPHPRSRHAPYPDPHRRGCLALGLDPSPPAAGRLVAARAVRRCAGGLCRPDRGPAPRPVGPAPLPRPRRPPPGP